MKGDPKVIEFLNDGLRHELTSINGTGFTTGCSRIGVSKSWRRNGVRNR